MAAVPGSDFTHTVKPTNRSAIDSIDAAIRRFRDGHTTGQEALWDIRDIMAAHDDDTRSSVAEPGNPLWNCCKARPARVMRFDDGSATVVCESCSHTVSRARIFDMPAFWTPGPDAD